jgi:predicted metal-binding membrane protein
MPVSSYSVNKALVVTGLCVVIACAWAYLVPASLDMYGRMDGVAAWMMEATWDARYLLLVFLMWAAMMVAMMLPGALPTIVLFQRALRNDPKVRSAARGMFAFAAGYVLAWAGFSAGATLLQWALAEAALLSPMMVSASPALGGTLLVVAGVYQWTPFKHACLRSCQSPLAFLAQHWRPGTPGALRLGFAHGLACVGCCWALMLLLFVGGVMNLLWIAAITVFVLVEKLLPHGSRAGPLVSALSGLGLIVAGAWVLASWSLTR